ASLLLAVLVAGTGVGLVVPHTRAGAESDNPPAVADNLSEPQKTGPKPKAAKDPKEEISKLRLENAKLKRDLTVALNQIKELKAAPVADEANFEVIHLRNASAVQAQEILVQAFRGRVRLVADPQTNSLLVSGSLSDVKKVRILVQETFD